jgi:hypothetical protein
MARRSFLFLLAVLLCVLFAGCGGDSETDAAETEETEAAETEPAETEAPPGLEKYLLQDDEVPGLEPVGSPRTDSGPPFDLPAEGTELLEQVGYISTTFQPAEGNGEGGGAGVSSVLLFETEAGARDWMAYETSEESLESQIPGGTFEPFEVADVPGAHGWTGPDLHGNAIGQVYWTQGRCMMLIGLEVEGPRVERLSAGVEAVYERTGGTCPD